MSGTHESLLLSNPRLQAAITEFTELIRAHYPETTFSTEVDEHDEVVYLVAVVDLDDPDEVVDIYIDRLVTLIVDEGLPLHILVHRTPERDAKLLAELQRTRPSPRRTRSSLGQSVLLGD